MATGDRELSWYVPDFPPSPIFPWLHPDLAAMAAAYLYHIACNHPFVDGNKRVAAMAAFVFLDLNGVDLIAPAHELERAVLAVAAGSMSKRALIGWMQEQTEAR